MNRIIIQPKKYMHLRAVKVILGVFVTALVAAACGSSSATSSNQKSNSTPNTASGEPSATFTVAQAAPINNLIPQPYFQSNMTWDKAIFNTLLGTGGQGQPTPELASSWTWSKNNTALTLNLEPNVTFQDGTPLTPAEVVQNLKWDATPANIASGGGLLASATYSTTATSVTITFPTQVPQILSAFAVMPIMKITPNMAQHPIGTGPFQVTSFTPGSELVLSRNDRYWNKAQQPTIKQYIIKIFPDPTAAEVALESGQVNALAYPAMSAVPQLKQKGLVIQSLPAGGIYQLQVNVSSGPLSKPLVRQALSLAFDRATFAKLELHGLGTPTCEIWPPTSTAFDSSLNTGCSYNLTEAKKLLAQAGYPNGFQLTASTTSVRLPSETQFLPIYQAALAKIGVTMTIQDLSPTVWQSDFLTGKFPGVTANWYGFENLDPAMLFSAPPFNPAKNASNFSSSAYKTMVKQAQAETDTALRKTMYGNIAKFAQQQEWLIPLATRPYIYALQPNVKHFSINRWGMAVMHGVQVG